MAALAAAREQSAALQQELAGRPAQGEMAALRQRVEALRLLVDPCEEEEINKPGAPAASSTL